MTEHYLDDFAAGQTFNTGKVRVDKEQIFAFAKEFDPQPFHLDEQAALKSPFQGLAASGWHTAAMTMRLLLDWALEHGLGDLGGLAVTAPRLEDTYLQLTTVNGDDA